MPKLDIKNVSPQVLALLEHALKTIDHKYGNKSLNYLPYHDTHHTLDVLDSILLLADLAAKNGKVNERDRELLILAAAYHDIEQGSKDKNEFLSADQLTTEMKKIGGFNKDDYDLASDLVMATIVKFDGDGKMYQSATRDYRTKLFTDADLASLGRPTLHFKKRMKQFYLEIYRGSAPTDKLWKKFIIDEIDFLKSHSFYTKEADLLFPHKLDNILYLTKILK